MNRKRLAYYIILYLCLLMNISTSKAKESQKNIVATLPNVDISFNGTRVDNTYRQYPVLLINGELHLPITWFDTRYLGIESTNYEDIITLETTGVLSSYHPYTRPVANPKKVTVREDNKEIIINKISTSSLGIKKYTFRDIIYVPLTTLSQLLSLDIIFNEGTVAIHSQNPYLNSYTLPEVKRYEGTTRQIIYKGDLYYSTFEEIDSNSNKITVIKHDIDTNTDIVLLEYEGHVVCFWNFIILDNKLFFTYQNNPPRGANTTYRVDNNSIIKLPTDHSYIIAMGNDYLVTEFSGPPYPNNITGLTKELELFSVIPSDIYKYYNYNVEYREGGGQSIGYSKHIQFMDNKLYILMSDCPNIGADAKCNRLITLNPYTKDIRLIIDEDIADFRIDSNRIYYCKTNDLGVYTCLLDSTDNKKLTSEDIGAEWFILNNIIFYIKEQQLYCLSTEEDKANTPTLLLDSPVLEMKQYNDYLILRVDHPDYNIVIWDCTKNEIAYRVFEKISAFTIGADELIFYPKDGSYLYSLDFNYLD